VGLQVAPDGGGTQGSSVVIRGPTACRSHLMGEATRGHQRPSEAIRGHRRRSESLGGNQRALLEASTHARTRGRCERAAGVNAWRVVLGR
jgi:hypothetical protein